MEVSGYKYQALLDTGSPFLTSPSDVSYLTRRGGRWFEPRTTREQYGNDIYELRWGKGRVLLGDALDVGELEVGSNVEGAERDQVLVGLVVKDSKRKSLMEQLGGESSREGTLTLITAMADPNTCRRRSNAASSFELDSLPSPKLVLSRERLEPPRNSVTYPLYDLTKWGTNVHHYGIKLTGGKFGGVRFGSGRGVRGDVVVVIDTGLTGCAISRTLRDSFPNLPPDQSISSVSLTLEDGTPLEANGLKNFETVDLPWFDNGREGGEEGWRKGGGRVERSDSGTSHTTTSNNLLLAPSSPPPPSLLAPSEPLIVAVGVDFFGDHKYKMKGITVNPGSISLALS